MEKERCIRNQWIFFFLALICFIPIGFSYCAYYLFSGNRNLVNYGTLIEPQRHIPDLLMVNTLEGKIIPMQHYVGKWLMLAVSSGACYGTCPKNLYFMRQLRAAQGLEKDRILTILFCTDEKKISSDVTKAYKNTLFLFTSRHSLDKWLPAEENSRIEDHIFLVDPNGNLMMRFPKNPDASKINRDLVRLLKWSRLG